MKYSIEVLEKEKQLLEKCLSDWELNKYPEARKERLNKLTDLNNVIKLVNNYIDPKKILFSFEEFWNINNCDGEDFEKVVNNFIKKNFK